MDIIQMRVCVDVWPEIVVHSSAKKSSADLEHALARRIETVGLLCVAQFDVVVDVAVAVDLAAVRLVLLFRRVWRPYDYRRRFPDRC